MCLKIKLMLAVMFQGDRCWRKSPADFRQAGGHEKLFPAFPEAKGSKEAFSEERGSSSSHSLHIFTDFLGSKPLRPARTVDKQSSNTVGFRLLHFYCSLPSLTTCSPAQWRSFLSAPFTFLLHFCFFTPSQRLPGR